MADVLIPLAFFLWGFVGGVMCARPPAAEEEEEEEKDAAKGYWVPLISSSF